MSNRALAIWLACLIACPSVPSAATPAQSSRPSAIVSQALKSADFLSAKIALDRIIDPSTDAASIERQVARLAEEARRIAGPRASEGAKIDAVRKVIYESGRWNDFRPFSYDHTDPLGQSIHNRLLSTYLKTRRGNCISMPILFLIVGRKIGLNLSLTTAPLHVLVRYTRAGIHPFNIEATSGGGFARDEWYRKNFPMSDKAVQSGIYLRTHTDRETIAEMAVAVHEHLLRAGKYEEVIKVSDAILAVNPLDAYTMVKRGDAIGRIMKAEFFDKYPRPELVPVHLRPRYMELATANHKAFADAEELGWEEPPSDYKPGYKASVKSP